jgi:threonine aldolase
MMNLPYRVIDLRSDTVTQPSLAMREAMMCAPLGDDVYGEDPSVNALQERIATLLGKESALFMPTGTQSNLAAVLSHCQRGDEVILGQQSHICCWEGGGLSALGGVSPYALANQADGTLDPADMAAALRPDDPHFARSRLLALENTMHGKPLPLPYLRRVTTWARGKGLASHLDGARLFNAAVAAGGDARQRAREIVDGFDSVSVCFSKGLGTPAGSALVGPAPLIREARRWRKVLGGGMRQSGLLAAAALHAIDHHIDRLADDHALARRLQQGLSALGGLVVQPAPTNMVFADLQGPDAEQRRQALVTQLRSEGVLVGGLYQLRFVVHLDVDRAGIDHTIDAVSRCLART